MDVVIKDIEIKDIVTKDVLIKTEHEICKMRLAGKLVAQTLEMIEPYIRPGISTAGLDRLCHDFIVDQLNAKPAALNYNGYPKSICTSVNHVVCHGVPQGNVILQSGDIINVDVTVLKDGYHADSSVTFVVGEVAPLVERLLRASQQCLYQGIAQVKPGARLGDIGAAIQQHAEKNGYSVVREYCGHGIGRFFHEQPQVLNYSPGHKRINRRSKQQLNDVEMIPGMTFTIEPMINQGARFVQLLTDNWTVVTWDRKWSAQWEHTLLVTATGCEILTLRSDESLP
ncbi:MAG: type I methionyl aminopeptidase [Pseudomonadales bacterium]|nr:type I methionyl aminopeptidase [Pseudomonadales bacterium]